MRAARLIAMTAILAGATLLPARAQDQNAARDALVKAAKAEGAVTLYTAVTPEDNALLSKMFESKYAIKVTTLKLNSGPLQTRFATEQASGIKNADTLEISVPSMFDHDPQWFLTLNDDNIPIWPSYPQNGKGKNYATAMVQPLVIQYNTKLVPKDKVPVDWKSMLDPFWKSRIVLTDPRATPSFMGWALTMERLYGDDYLKKLAAQDFTTVESATPGAQQVAAGSAYANFPAATVHSTDLKRKGAPIAYVIMKEGQNGPPTYVSVVASAPHPNAARLYLDFRLSKEVLTALCKQDEISSLYGAEIKECLPLPAGWAPVDFEAAQDKAVVARLSKALGLQ